LEPRGYRPAAAIEGENLLPGPGTQEKENEKQMTKQTISAKAKEAGMTAQTLRRTVAVVERCRREAESLQRWAETVTKEIRKKRKGLRGAMPSEWLEDRDGLRDDA